MFIKPFKIKNNLQLKGSDVKKVKQRIGEQFKTLSEVQLTNLFPTKAQVVAIKIITNLDAQITLYCVDKKPMFFETDDKILYPTLYAVWQSSEEFLPNFTTHPPVLQKLANGADLMLPGIVKEGNDRKSFGRLKKNQIVAVNLTSNKAACAIGTLARDSDDLYMAGGHGVCVKILHVFGDKLWGIEPGVTQQIPIAGPAVKAPNLNLEEDFPALGAAPVETKTEKLNKQLQQVELSDDDDSEDGEEEAVVITPDQSMKYVFLSCLKINKKELLSGLPILVNTFYPNYVQKALQQSSTPELTIKNTTHKKVSTFFQRMSEDGIIVIREETKGVEKIIAINYDHPDLISVIPQKPAKSEDKIACEPSSHLLLTKMTELYVVNEETKKFFSALGIATDSSLDSLQVKNHLKDYAGRKKLVDPITKGILMDDLLKEVCFGAIERCQKSIMSLDEIYSIILNKMDNTFEMRSQTGPQIKGGRKPLIQITTANRKGNKKVTLICNLDAYGVNIAEFSKACRIGVAASTTMTKIPGTSIDQFMVQGNQVKFIVDLLTQTYKIPKASITGMEFAKKEKKAKK